MGIVRYQCEHHSDEYPGFGSARFYEPCLKATLADGTRDLVLQYVSHRQPDANTLEVVTKDIQYDLQATLIYRVYPTGIIEKRTIIQNRTAQPITLEARNPASGICRRTNYRLSYLTGPLGRRDPVAAGADPCGNEDSGKPQRHTSHNFNPWFAIDDRRDAEEEHGRVWFGALGWSGNWRISRRADAVRTGARHRRVEHLRFRLSARSPVNRWKRRRFTAGYSAAWLRRHVATACIISNARTFCPDGLQSPPAARALQLLGSDYFQGGRSRARKRWRKKRPSSAWNYS